MMDTITDELVFTALYFVFYGPPIGVALWAFYALSDDG